MKRKTHPRIKVNFPKKSGYSRAKNKRIALVITLNKDAPFNLSFLNNDFRITIQKNIAITIIPM